MAIDRSDYDIKIKTTADLAALDDTSAALKKTGEAGKDAGELQSKGAEKSEIGHRELKEAISAVAREFGGLADVGLWLNPMTAALAAVLFAVGKIKEELGHATEAVAALATQTEAISAAKMKALADAARSAADNIVDLLNAQDKLDAAYAASDTAMENRIKQYGAEKEATLTVDQAKEASFEAEIRRRVALGKLTKESGDDIIANAKLQLEAEQGATSQAKLHEEIAARQKQLEEARERLFNQRDQSAIHTAQAAEAIQAGKSAAATEAANQAQTGSFNAGYTDWRGGKQTFTGNVDELKKQIREQRDIQQDQEEQGHQAIADRYKHDADALQDILNRQTKYIENLNRIADLEKQSLSTAKSHTEQATDQFTRDLDLNRAGDGRIKQLQDQYDLQAKTLAAVQSEHRRAGSIDSETRFIEAGQRIQAGHGTPAEMSQLQEQQAQSSAAYEQGPQSGVDAGNAILKGRNILSTLAGQGGRGSATQMAVVHGILDQIVGFLHNHSGYVSVQADNLADVKRRLEALEHQSRVNRIGPG